MCKASGGLWIPLHINLCAHIHMHARTYTKWRMGDDNDRSTTLTFLWESPWACSGVEKPHQWHKDMYKQTNTREGSVFRAALRLGSAASGSGSCSTLQNSIDGRCWFPCPPTGFVWTSSFCLLGDQPQSDASLSIQTVCMITCGNMIKVKLQ